MPIRMSARLDCRPDRGDAMSIADGALVCLALQGRETALMLLFKRHGARLRNLIVRRLADADDVADVLQETQLAVWRALPTYDPDRCFESWLSTIAINKCRDWGRRRAVRRDTLARFQVDPLHGGQWAWINHAENTLMEDERLAALRRALTELPGHLREPLIRTALLQLPQAAVARDLKLTIKAVEMRVRRARQHLHSALAAS